MTLKAKAAVAAAVILLLAGWIGWRRSSPEMQPAPVVVAAVKPPVAPPTPPAPPTIPEPARVEEAPPPPLPAPVVEPRLERGAPPVDPPVVPKEEGPRIVYSGRVLDDRRRPVAAAAVSFRVGDLPEVRTTSGDGGRFEIRYPTFDPMSPHLNGVLRAIAPDGQAGIRTVGWQSWSAFTMDLEVMVRSPATLRLQVVDGRGAVAGASVFVWTGYARLAKVETGEDGRAEIGPIPGQIDPGFGGPSLAIIAHAEGRGSARTLVDWPPPDSDPVTLRLTSKDYPVQIVDGATGRGIEGAEVRLRDWFQDRRFDGTIPREGSGGPVRTGPGGLVTIRGLSEDEKYQVTALADGYGNFERQPWAWYLLKRDQPTRIALDPVRTIRWPVTDAEGPVPPHGTTVRLQWGSRSRSAWAIASGWSPAVPLVTEGRIHVSRSDGAWLIIDGLGGGARPEGNRYPFNPLLWAVAPDGGMVRIPALGPADIGPAVSFRAPRTLTVDVKDDAGQPCVGVEVKVEGTGSLRQVYEEYALSGPDGRVEIPGLYGGPVLVFLREVHSPAFSRFPAGKADLEKGDAHLEALVPDRAPVEVLVRVRIGGEPRLPDRYTMVVNQERDAILIEKCTEDGQAGTLRFTVWLAHPAQAFSLSLGSRFLPGTPLVVPAGDRRDPVEVIAQLTEPGPAPPPTTAATPAPKPNPLLPGETSDQRANRILDTDRTTFSFEKMHLGFLLQYLSVRHGLNMGLAGEIERDLYDLEITVKADNLSVRDALVKVLSAREDLGFVVRDGTVIVVRR